jgi:dTDP-L-rhamnose 4-epimerase
MKKILLTGGAGFIGAELVKQLDENGSFEITVLDVLSEQIHGAESEKSNLFRAIQDRCRFIRADIRDLDAVRQTIGENEIIIHLAAETGTGQSMYRINRYNEVNVMGTSNLFQAISLLGKKSNVSKLILTSSRAVYGEGKYTCSHCGSVYPKGRSVEKMQRGDFAVYCDQCGEKLSPAPTPEDAAITPRSLYAFTKYAQEKMLETMCPALDIGYTIFRLQNVYGVGQSLRNPYTGILSIFSSLLLENRPVNIFEDGKESRDFIHVSDVAAAIIQSLECPETNGQVINLGSGVGTDVLTVTRMLKEIYGSKSSIKVTGDFRIGDIAYNVADIGRAQRLLGFKHHVGLRQGMESFCAWVAGQKCDSSGYENSLDEMKRAGMFIQH